MTGVIPPGENRYVLGVDLGTSERKVCLITEAGAVYHQYWAGAV